VKQSFSKLFYFYPERDNDIYQFDLSERRVSGPAFKRFLYKKNHVNSSVQTFENFCPAGKGMKRGIANKYKIHSKLKSLLG
jgi:hypothetical protein